MPIQPSWRKGFARFAHQSDAPEQWRGEVGCWAPFLGAQGASLFEQSGLGASGVLTNFNLTTCWIPSALFGTSLQFDGVDSIVSIPTTIAQQVSDWTFSAWVYWVIGTDTHNGIVHGLGGVGDVQSNRILVDTATSQLLVQDDGTISLVSVGALIANAWNYIAVTLSAGTTTIYLNGRFDASIGGANFATGTGSMILGRGHASGFYFFAGAMAEIRLHARALIANEVMSIYSNPFARSRLRRRDVMKAPAVVSFNSDLAMMPSRQLIMWP